MFIYPIPCIPFPFEGDTGEDKERGAEAPLKHLLITPSMKKYMLGSWDDNKHILEKWGYTKYNYLSGDWWKRGRAETGLKGAKPL